MKLTFTSLVLAAPYAVSFQPIKLRRRETYILSSVGDGPPPNSGNSGSMDEFLDGFGKEESDNMKKARQYRSEESLPISFGSEEGTDDDNMQGMADKGKGKESEISFEGQSLIVDEPIIDDPIDDDESEEILLNNPYMKVVSDLTPSDLISKFTTSADPRVQNAVRSTILGLIGSLPKMAFDTTTITTGQRLASLMFQLQMTGYLFKNAEYRLSLTQSLNPIAGTMALPEVDSNDERKLDPLKGKVKGKLKIRYDAKNEDNTEEQSSAEVEVDAAAYMSELRSEVSKLRNDLAIQRKEQNEAIRKDLLVYIRTLPEMELRSLTNSISQDVLVAMKGLVHVVMAGIGEGEIAADTVTEQSGEAMAQLCMWQLVVGYNMRELEVREEMKKSLLKSSVSTGENKGTDFSEPGAFD
mmetsp:Transcript_12461/g.19206  ORF Transcript_12461/g.19206 Transcript_12461/m.19206 type:complete len:412 (-) Transcript_12461:50-1285(-)